MSESTYIWGTVTQVSPLRVKLDGDAAALVVTPDTIVDPLALAVSDRVRCELAQNRLIVHGRAGGLTTLTALPARTTAVEGRATALEQWSGANRPAFRVRHSTTFAGSGAQSDRLLAWNTIDSNQGSCWNAATSRFTAPVSALYQFKLGICQATVAVGPEAGIYKNGSLLGWLCIAYDDYITATGIITIALAAGDYVQSYWRNNNGTTVTIDGTRSFFAGELVG